MTPDSRMVSTPPNEDDGWNEWRQYVLLTLKSLVKDIAEMKSMLSNYHTEVAVLKVRAGIWGAIAGLVPSTIVLVYWLMTK